MIKAFSYPVVNPVAPLTPEQIAAVQAQLEAERAQLITSMAEKVLELLLANTNVQTAATPDDVAEIVTLASNLITDDAATNKTEIITEVKKK